MLRIVSVLIAPSCPRPPPKIQAQLGLTSAETTYASSSEWGALRSDAAISKGETLFPRIDVEKEIDALNALIPQPDGPGGAEACRPEKD